MQLSFITLALAFSALSVSAAPHSLAERAGKGGDKGNANKGNANNNNKGNAADAKAGGGGGDLQTSLTLDPSVLAKGFESDGQAQQEAGQVPSLTSRNNFINFCATTKLPITNGQQIKGGSCNPAPMGVIAGTDKMPASKFTFPKNMQTIKANQQFDIQMAIQNIVTGNFVNPNTNYYAAPQHTDDSGTIIGHSHFVVEKLDTIDQTKPTNPGTFAFFKGVNTPAKNGVLSVSVDKGLPAGIYRLASINAAANHQPVLVAIAQHGSLDDMVYFFVTEDGQPDAAAAGAQGNGTAAAGAAAGDAAAKGGAADAAKGGAAGAAKGGQAQAAKGAKGQGGKGAAGKGKGGKN
ncbi:hypothetical protein DENSPDRAFT_833649 [Dentipellis sp. KUC8613]|nr:hypothetical protein DENSPDRAFT_833649 [Dentipellis sp. KUC8613]